MEIQDLIKQIRQHKDQYATQFQNISYPNKSTGKTPNIQQLDKQTLYSSLKKQFRDPWKSISGYQRPWKIEGRV